jgi:hypothetical protein
LIKLKDCNRKRGWIGGEYCCDIERKSGKKDEDVKKMGRGGAK